ncbi:MAG: rsmC [Bacteroidetes bacterium]|nr:MAG: rsmC [Bacteroidota bacterium]
MLRFLVSTFWRPYVTWYLKKPRRYNRAGLSMLVQPGVFHPGFFFSTKFLLTFLEEKKAALKNKTFLELGAGSGLLGLFAGKHGAKVTASDISKTAVENIVANAASNHIAITAVHSDLFDRIDPQTFDFIVINPPYYKKKPATEAEQAWYCGEELEYFQELFSQLGNYMHPASEVYMILSDDCDLEGIRSIASQRQFGMKPETSKRIAWEINTIFRLKEKEP